MNKLKFFVIQRIIAMCSASIIICIALVSVAFSQVTTTNITHDEAIASLRTNRDRLLLTYAQRQGYQSAYDVWSIMSTSQKGVFLTITDLLGRRSFAHFNYNYDVYFSGDEDDQGFGCATLNQEAPNCNSGCYIHPVNYYGPSCFFVTKETCLEQNKCYSIENPRTDNDTVLNHVTTLYAVNGSNGSNCGGGEYNRVFFQADNEMITLYRDIQDGLPYWYNSQDLAGPHNPFTQSRETTQGQPTGQSQEWAFDYQATTMNRPGVYGIFDPHIMEMDIDYDTLHHSNPECSYNNTYGRTYYENHWYYKGLGGSAEFDYVPKSRVRGEF